MRRRPGTRKAPPGSDKRRLHCGWPGGSGCTSLSFPALRRNCACPRGSIAAFVLGLRPALRFWRGHCVRSAPVLAALSRRLPSVHACLFSLVRKKETACGMLRSCSAGRDRHSCVLAVSVRLSAMAGSLRVCTFLYGDLDGVTGVRGRGNGERGWRRGLCAFLRSRIGIASFSAGRTLGLRAPDCAKESSTLWTLFTLRRGYVGAYSPRRRPGTRKDPPGSNLWPGGSGCIAIISTRTIEDLPDSDLWSGRSCCIARQQVEAGTAG